MIQATTVQKLCKWQLSNEKGEMGDRKVCRSLKARNQRISFKAHKSSMVCSSQGLFLLEVGSDDAGMLRKSDLTMQDIYQSVKFQTIREWR